MFDFDPHLYRDEGLEKESLFAKCFPFSKLVRVGRFHYNDFQIRFYHLLQLNHLFI